jgi:lipopolysaccharide biosynthesis regulator YciM
VVPMLPVFLAIGWLYARRADALDDSFRDLVER